MATHSSVLAWRIPGMVEPGGLPSMGSHRVGHDWSNLAAAAARLVIVFLPRGKYLLISWLQSPSAVILEPRELKSLNVSIVSPSICHEVMGPDAMILVFWMLSFSQLFHSHLSLSSRGSLVLLYFLPLGLCCLHICSYWYFTRTLDSSLCFIHPGISHDVLCI